MPGKAVLLLLFITAACLASTAYPQDTTRILLERADTWEFSKAINPNVQRIIGNVIMSHDSAFLYCDSAWLDEVENSVIAYGNVHILISDTLNAFGDSLKYNGNTKIARLFGNAKLVDNQTVLTTDTMNFDRTTQIAQYDYWGKIVNGKNILVSKHGYYYTAIKEFFFKEKVHLINPQFDLRSDTLRYNTVTEVAYFLGPSNILAKKDSIYTENGWYNTTTDEARFRKNGKLYHEAQVLTGDSLYYDRDKGYGTVWNNGSLIDTAQNVLLMGNFGEYFREQGYAYMTKRAVTAMVDEKDTLFMHSDTVKGFFDTAENIKNVYAYKGVRFYRKDLQGMSDSLAYRSADSTMTMYGNPVLWSDENQLTADTMWLSIRYGKMDSIVMRGNAFIVALDDTGKYNQIKGRDMVGYFLNNRIYKLRVLGNAETIYWAREDDKSLIGIDKAVSSDMLIFISEGKLKTITYIGSPAAQLFPEKDLTPYDLKLRGFKWYDEYRPKEKNDIFREMKLKTGETREKVE
jgi:lipopolysaccharide export system protein LptA